MVQGRNLILALNNTAIAAAKSCSLKVQQNFIEACSPISGRTKKKIPTDYSWDLSCDCLMATPSYADSIVEMVKNGTMVTIQFYDLTLGMYRYGNAYVANATIDGSVGSLSKLSISLTGSEELNKLSWTNIEYTLSPILHADRPDQSGDGFWYDQQGLRGLYIARMVNNQYIRVDSDASIWELSNPIDDDSYLRGALFQGGYDTYYMVTCASDVATGGVITPKMVYEVKCNAIQYLPNSWFELWCSAVWTDEPAHQGDPTNEEVHVYDITIKRHETT